MSRLKIFDPSYKKSINQHFRQKRFAFFRRLLASVSSGKPVRILDIGGTQNYWERMNFTDHEHVHITLLNLDVMPVKNKNFTSIKGNAWDLSRFRDKEFDIVYSNSVIEHLFTKENQKKMAEEVRRVGKYYYIQTPNFYFPVEPHMMFPLFQYLPFSTRVFLTKKLNLRGYKNGDAEEVAVQKVDEIKLLTDKEMQSLFPDGNLYKERLFLLTKSLTMYNFSNV